MRVRTGVAAVLFACGTFAVSGCVDEVTGNEEPDAMMPVEPDGADLSREAHDELREQQRMFEEQAQTWTCSWSPTMNRNWHDDALCTNGSEFERPYLRPGDTYITPDELMSSAREWASRQP
jgi:hypothetical protein